MTTQCFIPFINSWLEHFSWIISFELMTNILIFSFTTLFYFLIILLFPFYFLTEVYLTENIILVLSVKQRFDTFVCGIGKDSWESLRQQDQTSQS